MSDFTAYIGTKIIQAKRMSERMFLATVKGERLTGKVNRHGYLVVYPGGYKSWSPKDVFEQAYRQISDEETRMIQ